MGTTFVNVNVNGNAAASSGISWVPLIVSIITIVAWWKVFEKAGEAGWKAIIPVYNIYILYKISGKVGLWIQGLIANVLLWGGLAFTIVMLGMESSAFMIGVLLLLVIAVWQIVIRFKQCKGLATKFGQPTSFAVGMFFFETIFMMILGFGKYQYNDTME